MSTSTIGFWMQVRTYTSSHSSQAVLFEVFSDNTTGVVTSVSNDSLLIEGGNYKCNLETKQGVLEYSLYSIDDAVYIISPSTYTPTLTNLDSIANCGVYSKSAIANYTDFEICGNPFINVRVIGYTINNIYALSKTYNEEGAEATNNVVTSYGSGISNGATITTPSNTDSAYTVSYTSPDHLGVDQTTIRTVNMKANATTFASSWTPVTGTDITPSTVSGELVVLSDTANQAGDNYLAYDQLYLSSDSKIQCDVNVVTGENCGVFLGEQHNSGVHSGSGTVVGYLLRLQTDAFLSSELQLIRYHVDGTQTGLVIISNNSLMNEGKTFRLSLATRKGILTYSARSIDDATDIVNSTHTPSTVSYTSVGRCGVYTRNMTEGYYTDFEISGNEPLTNSTIGNAVDDFLAGGSAKTNIIIQYGDINQWNTSAVTNMYELFRDAANFNENINNWDVSSVTNMNRMFKNATSFNQQLNNWDVSSVTNMGYMFEYATNFNQPLNNWDVSSVTNMNSMFRRATDFNQPLDNWDVSKVTDMRVMFEYATNFNQSLNNWDVSSVTNMTRMFQVATNFNQSLNDWDVSSVTNMSYMFRNATSFNQQLNNWDVSSVRNMTRMFRDATSFNQPLNDWDVSSVTNMSYMFRNATSFNQQLNNWDVSSVTNMNRMFYGATSFNQQLNNWDVSSVTNMNRMFEYATNFNQSLNNWDVSSVTNMDRMFYEAEDFNQQLNNWDVSSVTNMDKMFDGSDMSESNATWYDW